MKCSPRTHFRGPWTRSRLLSRLKRWRQYPFGPHIPREKRAEAEALIAVNARGLGWLALRRHYKAVVRLLNYSFYEAFPREFYVPNFAEMMNTRTTLIWAPRR